ncbi:MAG: hypothetical protein LBV64_05765 [Mediterranea sp.]|nr:hypothetical protein [Mediterranea sp.]
MLVSDVRMGVRDFSENPWLTSLRGKKDCSGKPDPDGGTLYELKIES